MEMVSKVVDGALGDAESGYSEVAKNIPVEENSNRVLKILNGMV